MNWKRASEVFRLVASFLIVFFFWAVFFAIVSLMCFGDGPVQGEVFGFSYDVKLVAGMWVWLSALAIACLSMRRNLRKAGQP